MRATPRAPPIVYIAGDENCGADLLSRWVTRPEGPVFVHASVKYTEVLFAGGDKFPTKEVVHGVQAATAEGGPTRDTAMGVVSVDSEGLYRVHHGHRVIWVPAGTDSLKKRLLVCAHLEGTEHRGLDATMARLEQHCVWDRGKTAAFHGRRLRSGDSSIQAGQAPQAHEHLDRAVACCQRRQIWGVRGAALGHSRTARRPRGEDAGLRR